MVTPRLTIDGYPAPAQRGPNAYPVAPGRHLVKGSANDLLEFGSAEQVVEINPGPVGRCHYSPPLITFFGGRMGFGEQPRPGSAVFWVIVAIPIVIILVAFIGIATSG